MPGSQVYTEDHVLYNIEWGLCYAGCSRKAWPVSYLFSQFPLKGRVCFFFPTELRKIKTSLPFQA